jgi:hypothetical protein
VVIDIPKAPVSIMILSFTTIHSTLELCSSTVYILAVPGGEHRIYESGSVLTLGERRIYESGSVLTLGERRIYESGSVLTLGERRQSETMMDNTMEAATRVI